MKISKEMLKNKSEMNFFTFDNRSDQDSSYRLAIRTTNEEDVFEVFKSFLSDDREEVVVKGNFKECISKANEVASANVKLELSNGEGEGIMDMDEKIVAYCKENPHYNENNPEDYRKVFGIIAEQVAGSSLTVKIATDTSMHDKIVEFCKVNEDYNADNPDHYQKAYTIIAGVEAYLESHPEEDKGDIKTYSKVYDDMLGWKKG